MLIFVAAEALLSGIVFALQEVPRGHGFWTLAGIGLLALSLPLMLRVMRRDATPHGVATRRLLFVAGTAFAASQLAFAVLRTVTPKVIDIGWTTVDAVFATVHGHDPYASSIDQLAGGLGGSPEFHGYKYWPMMIVVYAPLVLALGLRGIVVTNVVLQASMASGLGALGSRLGGPIAGLAAAVLYLSLPFLAFQAVARGVNDLAPLLPLTAALLLIDRRPFWSGLLVGLSIAMKPLPGVAVLPCLLPASGSRVRYGLGVAVGLVPILPFVAAMPVAFFDNAVAFSGMRQIDDTSWLYGLPGIVTPLARGAAIAALCVLYLRIWRRPPPLEARCAAATLAILLVFAVSPAMHHNYYLWFIPFLTLMIACSATGGVAKRGASVKIAAPA